MIELEGIKLTPEIITLIKDWQTVYLQTTIECIDDAISFVARESNCTSPEEGQHNLTLISRLCTIKEELKTFKIKTT